jgi:hypothetical protein
LGLGINELQRDWEFRIYFRNWTTSTLRTAIFTLERLFIRLEKETHAMNWRRWSLNDEFPMRIFIMVRVFEWKTRFEGLHKSDGKWDQILPQLSRWKLNDQT